MRSTYWMLNIQTSSNKLDRETGPLEDEPGKRTGTASKADGSFDERGWVASTPSSAMESKLDRV